MNWSWQKQFGVGMVAACCVVTSACAGSAGSDGSSATESTAAADSDEATTTPEVAPPTEVAETVAPTTEPVDPCADFDALLGYERMMAVKDGTAPTDEACKPAVDRSALALNTYENGLVFSEQFANTEVEEVLQIGDCDQGATFANVFEVPVIYWGVTRTLRDDTVTSYEPFVSDVLLPGASWSLPIPGLYSGDNNRCWVNYEGIVAPTGGLAAGIDGAPAPDDDPLASDDYQVWGPALFDPDTNAMAVAELVNRIEDIHSNDVGNHVRDLESGEADAAEDEADAAADEVAEDPIRTFCGSEPADLGADVAGTYAWLVYAAQREDAQGHGVGLFSRGADNRWRFVGTVVEIDDVVDPNDPCKMPPRSGG